MLNGSCLCQKIKFQAEEIPGVVYNCHCSRCRKSHGSAFATQVFAKKSSLKFLQGKQLLKEYQSTGGLRTFCGECGSRLMNYGNEGVDYLSIAVSAIDNASNIQPAGECFTANKLDWVSLMQGIPAFTGLPK